MISCLHVWDIIAFMNQLFQWQLITNTGSERGTLIVRVCTYFLDREGKPLWHNKYISEPIGKCGDRVHLGN